MTRIRRGGFIFLTWKGDHPPYHVHVFRDGQLILKWDLERNRSMEGQSSAFLLDLIRELRESGRL